MKRSLSILFVLLIFFVSNIETWALVVNEQVDDSETNEEDTSVTSADSDLNVNMENHSIIIGDGSEIQIRDVFLNQFSSYYFSQLTVNFGYNYKGTCSYVAMAMLLSYYDNYWDDSIILDNYDQTIYFDPYESIVNFKLAPGIKKEKSEIDKLEYDKGLNDDEKLSDSDYANFILSGSNEYFHLKLLNIGTNILNKSFAIAGWDAKDILEYYLYTERGFSSSNVTVEFVDWYYEHKREYIIDKVEQGIPVIVFAGDYNDILSGHSYIIYDYDANGDELYCHTGWEKNNGQDRTHISFSTMDETMLCGIISLNIDESYNHSHSNNYVDTEGNKYCSCYFPIHPQHVHEYEACVGAESTHHVYKCGCAAEGNVTFYHNFEYVNITTNGHQEVCSDCGYERDVLEHSFQYGSASDINHHARCSHCGYETTKYHTFECDGTENGLHYEKCVDCEYREIRITNVQYSSSGDEQHTKSCSECGYETEVDHYFVYKNMGALYHILTCKYCGETSGSQAGHIWISTENDSYFECKICGYLKFHGSGFIPIIKTKLPNKEEET